MASLAELQQINASLPAIGRAPHPAPPADDAATWGSPALAAKMKAAQAAFENPKSGQPKLPPGKTSGWLANIGAGTSEGVAGTLGFLPDVAAAAINLPIEGIRAATGAHIPTIQHPIGGTEWWERVEGLIGANPQNVVPASRGQQLARAAAAGATAMALPGGVARGLPAAAGPVAEAIREGIADGATVGGVTAGATGGIGGQLAQEQVPEKYRSLANFIGQLAGGALPIGAEAALRGGARALGDATHAVVAPTGIGQRAEPVIDPATGRPFTAGVGGEPIKATPWQAQTAGRAVAKAMGQIPGEAAATMPEQPGLVPGVQHTIGTLTGDIGTLGEERRLQMTPYGRARFAEQEAANNAARMRNLEQLTPAEAAEAARDWMRARLAQVQAQEEAGAASGRAAGESAMEAAGAGPGLPDVRTIGQGQQGALEAMRVPHKAQVSDPFEKMDPEGKLALDTSGIADAGDAAARVGKGGRLLDAEHAVIKDAQTMRGVHPFQELRELYHNTAAAMREIGKDTKHGSESPPYRRVSGVMRAIHAAMADAAGRAAEAEAASGQPAEGGILAQIRSDNAREPGAVPGAANPNLPGGTAGELAGAVGPAEAAGGQVPAGEAGAYAPGNRPVAAAPATPLALLRKPQNLLEFLTERGGIKPDADLQAMGADAYHHRAGGRLLNLKGEALDYAREAAQQEGFPGMGDINGLKDKIAEGLAGRHTYRESEALEAHQYQQAKAEQDAYDAAYQQARGEVLHVEDQFGMHLSRSEIDHAISMRMQDPNMHPEEALRRAAAASEDERLQRNAQRDAFGFPGLPAAAEQPEIPLATGLVEHFPAADLENYRAANRAYAQYKDTWRKGVIGEVIKPGARRGEFAMGASEVPGALWAGGPKGADVAAEAVKKLGREKALEVLGDYPALTFRNAVLKDGRWNEAGYRRWLNSFAPALSQFPEIADQFRTPAEAMRSAEEAAIRGQQRVEAFQNSAARHFLAKNGREVEPQAAIDSLTRSPTAGADARELMKLVGPNHAVVDGLRRNFVEWATRKMTGTGEAGTSGVSELANAATQRLLANPNVRAVGQAILTPEQWQSLKNGEEDLRLSQRLWKATQIKGSPATAADWLAQAKERGEGFSHAVSLILLERAGEELSAAAGAARGVPRMLGGGVMAAASEIYRGMRAAGFQRAEQLTIESHLNPALGRVLAQRAVDNPRAPILRDTARRIMALSIGAGISSHGRGH